MAGQLFYGDNLDVLRLHVKDESVDLVYLDPPFNSKASYNVLFGTPDGAKAAAQIEAFDDTWHWDLTAQAALEELIESPGSLSDTMDAFRRMLGASTMLAYLAMMAPRLVELRRVMKPSASIYLHCDPTASHYLKLLMDGVFGADNFLNEIIWHYKAGSVGKKTFGKKHDTILRYAQDKREVFFDPDPIREPYAKSTLDRLKYAGAREKDVEKVLKRGGKVPTDVWEIGIVQGNSAEAQHYPTQKPEALLERIIASSCPPDGVVLDPFCGCGTTIAAAHTLGREWMGIDITSLATALIKTRLDEVEGVDYKVIGEPLTIDDAARLAQEDKFQFQFWALGLVGARPDVSDQKMGADKGIDGRVIFYEGTTEPKQVIISVKGGKVSVPQVRDLVGVIAREKAEVGVLLSFNEPTGPMKQEAAEAGLYSSTYGKHPRIQLLTVGELLEGKSLDLPPEALQKMKVVHSAAGKGEVDNQLTLGADLETSADDS